MSEEFCIKLFLFLLLLIHLYLLITFDTSQIPTYKFKIFINDQIKFTARIPQYQDCHVKTNGHGEANQTPSKFHLDISLSIRSFVLAPLREYKHATSSSIYEKFIENFNLIIEFILQSFSRTNVNTHEQI